MSEDVARQTYPFDLPALPYAYDALEPHFDRRTMELHHQGHHATYVKKLNEALEKQPDLQRLTLEQLLDQNAKLPEAARAAIRNNGGGHLNHVFFWNSLAPASGAVRAPKGRLAEAIAREFGTVDELRKRFSDAAARHFASGWVALAVDKPSGTLVVVDLKDHDVLDPERHTGLMILDVWEHAYYLKFQNRRPEFISSFWNVLNWAEASDEYDRAASQEKREWRSAS